MAFYGLRLLQLGVATDNNIWEVTDCQFIVWGLYSWLWSKATIFEMSQSTNSWPKAYKVGCSRRPQYLTSHRESILGLRPLWFIVDKDHHIWENIECQLVSCSLYSWLWLKATIFDRSQRANLFPEFFTVCCKQKPQYLRSRRLLICSLRSLQVVVAKRDNVYEITCQNSDILWCLYWR